MININHQITEQGVKFTVQSGNTIIKLNEWVKYDHPAITLLLSFINSIDDSQKLSTENSIHIPNDSLSNLTVTAATALGLPPLANVVLQIEHEGLLAKNNFRLICKWLRDSHRPIVGAKRVGCFLYIGDKSYRLPYELFHLSNSIDEINNTSPNDIESKLLAWAHIDSLLPKDSSGLVKTDGFLKSTRVYCANAFRLSVKPTKDGFDFDPILLRSKLDDSLEYYTNPQINFEELLIPDIQDKFIKHGFRQFHEVNTNYAIGEGNYIILDKPLKKALSIIHEMQRASPEVRLQFLKNPKSFLVEQLGDDYIEGSLDSVFSDRVEGFGERRVKVLPWIKVEGQEWFPNENSPRGIIIRTSKGDEVITLESKQANVLQTQIVEAIKEGKNNVSFNGVSIPANQDTLAKIGAIGIASPTTSTSKTPNKEKAKPYVLYVKDNFGEIHHQPALNPRAKVGSFNFANITSIKRTPKKHQLEGIRWMADAFRLGLNGVLLADDMGLGKTFQALSFLAWVKLQMEENNIEKAPLLIVAPTGLLDNWAEEHDEHFHHPGLGVLERVYGKHLKNIKSRKDSDNLITPLDLDKIRNADWVLTTYETLSNYQTSFSAIHFTAVVFDEMQKIKTPNTQLTEASQALNADFIVGMTGTPIENRLADLWCLVDTLQPGRLGALQSFSKKYESDFDYTLSLDLKSELTKFSEKTPPLMLRRMKEDELQGLPKIYYHFNEKEMPSIQAEAYSNVVNQANASENGAGLLEALHKLRAICLHPFDFGGVHDEAYIAQSARLIETFKILHSISEKKEKALIFIESRTWHDFLPAMIQRMFNLTNQPMLISGEVKGSDRQKRVNLFKQDTDNFDVMLLSPRAGGVGLNLVAANHVIHLSRWWNPAVEDQCTGRAYRMKQKKDVHVYYPIAIHPVLGDKSFDKRLNKLLEEKRRLSKTLLLPASDPRDQDRLIRDTILNVGDLKKNLTDTKEHDYSFVHTMEPKQFENWVANQLQSSGLIVQKTIQSWDGGADMIVRDIENNIIAIVQCKHTQNEEAPYNAVSDLLRAKDAYNSYNPKLLAITNAKRFGKSAMDLAKFNNNLLLITINELKTLSLLLQQ